MFPTKMLSRENFFVARQFLNGNAASSFQLMSPVAVAGLLATILSFLDVKSTILGKSHYLLYGLATAIQPRMLVTFDENCQPLPVTVRVGQAVDVVGQAGKPKNITGFQVRRKQGFVERIGYRRTNSNATKLRSQSYGF
jgi:CRISPR-associated Cas5-like protein